jgi:hypothetical protein
VTKLERAVEQIQIHAKMANLRFIEDYQNYFDPKIYLGHFYEKLKGDENDYPSTVSVIKAFHEFWSIFKAPNGTDVRYLEFGGGPSIAMQPCFCLPKSGSYCLCRVCRSE